MLADRRRIWPRGGLWDEAAGDCGNGGGKTRLPSSVYGREGPDTGLEVAACAFWLAIKPSWVNSGREGVWIPPEPLALRPLALPWLDGRIWSAGCDPSATPSDASSCDVPAFSESSISPCNLLYSLSSSRISLMTCSLYSAYSRSTNAAIRTSVVEAEAGGENEGDSFRFRGLGPLL